MSLNNNNTPKRPRRPTRDKIERRRSQALVNEQVTALQIAAKKELMESQETPLPSRPDPNRPASLSSRSPFKNLISGVTGGVGVSVSSLSGSSSGWSSESGSGNSNNSGGSTSTSSSSHSGSSVVNTSLGSVSNRFKSAKLPSFFNRSNTDEDISSSPSNPSNPSNPASGGEDWHSKYLQEKSINEDLKKENMDLIVAFTNFQATMGQEEVYIYIYVYMYICI